MKELTCAIEEGGSPLQSAQKRFPEPSPHSYMYCSQIRRISFLPTSFSSSNKRVTDILAGDRLCVRGVCSIFVGGGMTKKRSPFFVFVFLFFMCFSLFAYSV